jgi:hypothetical protein
LDAVVGLPVSHHQHQPRTSNVVRTKRARPNPRLELLSLGRIETQWRGHSAC